MRTIILEVLAEYGYDVPLDESRDKHKIELNVKFSKQLEFKDTRLSGYYTTL